MSPNRKLANKITRLEQEIKSLKATQQYGLEQVQAFNSEPIELTSYQMTIVAGGESSTITNNVYAELSFTGELPAKTLACELWFGDMRTSKVWNFYQSTVYRPINDCSMEIAVFIENFQPELPFSPGSGGTASFVIPVYVKTNMKGVFSLISSRGFDGFYD